MDHRTKIEVSCPIGLSTPWKHQRIIEQNIFWPRHEFIISISNALSLSPVNFFSNHPLYWYICQLSFMLYYQISTTNSLFSVHQPRLDPFVIHHSPIRVNHSPIPSWSLSNGNNPTHIPSHVHDIDISNGMAWLLFQSQGYLWSRICSSLHSQQYFP